MIAGKRADTRSTQLRLVGALGMAVFFGCLLAYDEAGRAPAWLVWPALTATLVGVFGSLAVEWRTGERTGSTVLIALAAAGAAFAVALLI